MGRELKCLFPGIFLHILLITGTVTTVEKRASSCFLGVVLEIANIFIGSVRTKK